jgi:hypothetical protein
MDPMIDDVYVLAALRLAAGSDPAPAAVGADAEAAWALRLPGATTAQPVPLPGAAGARSGDGPRLVRFTSDEVTIEVEFAFCDGRVDVAGQVRAAPASTRRDDADPAPDARTAPEDPGPGAGASGATDARTAPEDPGPDPGASGATDARAAADSSDAGVASGGSGVGVDRPAAGEGDAGSTVEIRTLRGSEVRVPSRSGHFAATGLPPGWLSVSWHRPGSPPVATRWLCVRE